jgi:hypothetical protein
MTRTDLIKRAIESARCRLYKVRARESYSIDHQKKAENQTELMNITIEALEKQIPKKPIKHFVKPFGFPCYECPICGESDVCGQKYCDECGQALDWSEEEV